MTAPIIIGLCGRAGVGKDTAADYLEREYGFVSATFAQPLKIMLDALLCDANIDYTYLYEPKLKNVEIPQLGVSGRQLMQTLGDWGRSLSPTWWVRLLALNVGLDGAGSTPVHDRIVISDVRYPNEAAWVLAKSGHLVRIHYADFEPVREHSSESHVEFLPATVELYNDHTSLDGFHIKIDDAMRKLGIQPRGYWPEQEAAA